jgi:hypothetical protein
MATPQFQPVEHNQEYLDAIDVYMKNNADKSEQKIDLIPGGKHSRKGAQPKEGCGVPGCSPSFQNPQNRNLKKHRFCRYYDIKSFT